MPFRDYRLASLARGTYQGSTSTSEIAKSAGTYQTLGAENRTGVFIPGIYRVNPVMLEKWTGKHEWQPKLKFKNSHGYLGELSGHLAAVAACPACSLDKCRSVLSAYSKNTQTFVINRALAKACKPSTELGVMIGELRESISGLINPFSAARKSLLKIFSGLHYLPPKKRVREARRILRSVASTHLEVRVGLMPTWRSVCDLVDLVYRQQRLINGKLLRERASFKSVSVQAPVIRSFSLNGFSVYAQIQERRTDDYYASVGYHLNRGLTFNEENGLSGEHAPSIAWELVPLSFVVDRFLDVGTFLQTLAFDSARTLNGITVSRKVVLEYEAVVNLVTFWGSSISATGNKASFRYEYLDRKVGLSRPLLPAVNPNLLDVFQHLDHLALITQKLLKIRRPG